jgi:methylated-DNA-[protein]-cysteine S-methyltransferase
MPSSDHRRRAMTIRHAQLDTPLGPMLARADGGALIGLHFADEARVPAPAPDWMHAPDDPLFGRLAEQLREYFSGGLRVFELPLRPVGTVFQLRVWSVLQEIPYGVTTSYGGMARRLGSPGAMRAVGAANSRNPLAILIPCHRAIGADGSLTGYAGGVARKRALLEIEGALTAGGGTTLALL